MFAASARPLAVALGLPSRRSHSVNIAPVPSRETNPTRLLERTTVYARRALGDGLGPSISSTLIHTAHVTRCAARSCCCTHAFLPFRAPAVQSACRSPPPWTLAPPARRRRACVHACPNNAARALDPVFRTGHGALDKESSIGASCRCDWPLARYLGSSPFKSSLVDLVHDRHPKDDKGQDDQPGFRLMEDGRSRMRLIHAVLSVTSYVPWHAMRAARPCAVMAHNGSVIITAAVL